MQQSTRSSRLPNLHDRVSEVMETLRPMARRDGGDIELLRVDEGGLVHVRLHGACIGCPSSAITLTLGIERSLKDRIPEVRGVVCDEA